MTLLLACYFIRWTLWPLPEPTKPAFRITVELRP